MTEPRGRIWGNAASSIDPDVPAALVATKFAPPVAVPWPLRRAERHLLHGPSRQWTEYDRFGAREQGLGWKVIDDAGRPHYGGAFKAFTRLHPDENLGIVTLVNGSNVDRQDIADARADMGWG